MASQAELNTQAITEKSRRDLLRLLESVRGKKHLVVQKSLLGPIGLFLKFSTLQEYGVDRLFVLENQNVEPSQKNIVLLSRGERPKDVQAVADAIKQVRQNHTSSHEFSIIWTPRRTLLSDKILEKNGVLGEANVMSCALSFVALDEDVLSLEMEDTVNDLYLRRDPTSIYLTAQAIMSIQRQCGLIPRLLGKGDYALQLADLLVRLRAEEDVASSATSDETFLSRFGSVPSATIDSLIIIDRSVDFPSALATQLTYAGLLDENFSTKYNAIEVPTSVVGSSGPLNQNQSADASATTATAQTRKIQLDSSDALYPGLRDLNFAVLGPTLNNRARALQTNYEARHRADVSISDLKSFVQKLPSYQAEQASLRIHTALAEEILSTTRTDIFSKTLEIQQILIASGDSSASSIHEKIDDLISRNTPLSTVLRLLCLESTLTSGIRTRELEPLKRALLLAYGHQHILTLSNLEKMQLLTPRTSTLSSAAGYLNPVTTASAISSSATRAVSARTSTAPPALATDYPSVRRSMNLLVDDVDEAAQQDPAYVFSGYAPLSARLVQCALMPGWEKQRSAAAAGAPAQNGAASASDASVPSRTGPWSPAYNDALARIRGPTVDVLQQGAEAGASEARLALRGTGSAGKGSATAPSPMPTAAGTDGAAKSGAGKQRSVTSVVLFLGGVTSAEIAAVRLIGRQLRERKGGENRRVVIATTGIISGDRLVGGAIEKGTFA